MGAETLLDFLERHIDELPYLMGAREWLAFQATLKSCVEQMHDGMSAQQIEETIMPIYILIKNNPAVHSKLVKLYGENVFRHFYIASREDQSTMSGGIGRLRYSSASLDSEFCKDAEGSKTRDLLREGNFFTGGSGRFQSVRPLECTYQVNQVLNRFRALNNKLEYTRTGGEDKDRVADGICNKIFGFLRKIFLKFR